MDKPKRENHYIVAMNPHIDHYPADEMDAYIADLARRVLNWFYWLDKNQNCSEEELTDEGYDNLIAELESLIPDEKKKEEP